MGNLNGAQSEISDRKNRGMPFTAELYDRSRVKINSIIEIPMPVISVVKSALVTSSATTDREARQ